MGGWVVRVGVGGGGGGGGLMEMGSGLRGGSAEDWWMV